MGRGGSETRDYRSPNRHGQYLTVWRLKKEKKEKTEKHFSTLSSSWGTRKDQRQSVRESDVGMRENGESSRNKVEQGEGQKRVRYPVTLREAGVR